MMLLFGVDVSKCEEAPLELSETKPYTLTLTVVEVGGYDSNATQLGEGLPLPQGQSARGYGFFKTDDTADFTWTSPARNGQPPENQVELTYEYTQQFYSGLSGFDEGDHEWTAVYTHVFNGTWSGLATIDDKFVTFDGHSFSNKIWVSPEIDCLLGSHYTTRLASTLTQYDVFFPSTIPARDSDANRSTIEIYERIGFGKGDLIKIEPAFSHVWNQAEGSDYGFERNRLQIMLDASFDEATGAPWKNLHCKAKYFHDFDRYDHRNSHSGFTVARRDNYDSVDVLVTYDLLKNRNHIKGLSLTMEYNYIRNNSNLPEFNYGEHVVTAGCSVTFD